jgi:hypothetical protein
VEFNKVSKKIIPPRYTRMFKTQDDPKLQTKSYITEIIHAQGHQNILSTNKATFEITKDTHLTKRGDCIIAVNADKAAEDLSQEFKRAIRRQDAKVTITIEADTEKELIRAYGNPQLPLTHPTDLVVRKSNYICNRTLAIEADKAAKDFPKKLVEKLQNSKQSILISLTVEAPTRFQHPPRPAT